MWALQNRGHSHVQDMQRAADPRSVNLLLVNIVGIVLTCFQIRDATAHGLQVSVLIRSSRTLGIRFTAVAVVRGGHNCWCLRSTLIIFARVVNVQRDGLCFLSATDAGHQSRKRSAIARSSNSFPH